MSYESPVLLDLFSGGGGAALGYVRAGFRVIGVDAANHSKSYSRLGEFFHGDWEEGLAKYTDVADFIHASPPCQNYSRLTGWGRPQNLQQHPDLFGGRGAPSTHPGLVEAVRDVLTATGKPFVIENVEGSPLRNPITLCAWTFGYETYRHRLFEAHKTTITAPEHRPHVVRTSSPGHFIPGTFISVAGHCPPIALAREVMDLDLPRPELAESIPPYFTHWIGVQVIQQNLLSWLRRGGHGPEAREHVWKHHDQRHQAAELWE